MPSTSFSHRASVDASPNEVWARLQTADAWAEIGPIDEVWDAVNDEDGALRSFHWSTKAAGRSFHGTATTVLATPDERMIVDLDTSEVAGTVDVTISQSTIEVTMSLRSVGLLATMFFSVVADAVGGGLPGHVDHFASHFG